ncbi:MAG: MarR family winged helix-turn-helix transcriptional regulator [Vicinamibacterales bacterium]
MGASKEPPRPIGYWLKRADEVITRHINATQAGHGISREEWQVLNTVHETGGVSRARLTEGMRPFVDAHGVDAILARLEGRGWIACRAAEAGAVSIHVLPEGRRAHEAIHADQVEVRRRAMDGVSEGDYQTVIRVLQRLVSNLEPPDDGAS